MPHDGFALEAGDRSFFRPVIEETVRTIGQSIAQGIGMQTRISGFALPNPSVGISSQMREASDAECGSGG